MVDRGWRDAWCEQGEEATASVWVVMYLLQSGIDIIQVYCISNTENNIENISDAIISKCI